MDKIDTRVPRSMSEAFGPHASRYITEPKPTGYSRFWWSAMVAVCVVGLYFVVTGVPA